MIKFFRMSERGSISSPTITALMAIIPSALIEAIVLKQHWFICMAIAWPLTYLFFAVILSNPFRITLGRVMHWTRFHSILSSPTAADKNWLSANKELFEKTRLKVYEGESLSIIDKKIDFEENFDHKKKKSIKRINVSYGQDRKTT